MDGNETGYWICFAGLGLNRFSRFVSQCVNESLVKNDKNDLSKS